jgi:hypothetical protein
MSVNERRALSRAAIVNGSFHRLVACDWIAAIHFLDKKIGESGQKLRDASSGSLNLNGHRDRVPIVFDHVKDRQL